MNLVVDRDAMGGVTFTGSALAGELNVMSPRQRADLNVGLALLEASARPDEAFFSEDPIERALEVGAAHDLARASAAAEKQTPRFEEMT